MDKSLTDLQDGLYGVTGFAVLEDLGDVFERVELVGPVEREATLLSSLQ